MSISRLFRLLEFDNHGLRVEAARTLERAHFMTGPVRLNAIQPHQGSALGATRSFLRVNSLGVFHFGSLTCIGAGVDLFYGIFFGTVMASGSFQGLDCLWTTACAESVIGLLMSARGFCLSSTCCYFPK